MTPEKTNLEERPEDVEIVAAGPVADRGGPVTSVKTRTKGPQEKLGSLDVWARSAPIRLAGYEDDLAEPHILPSVD
ncbi:hypothetical protein ACFY93_18255 [Streptomyces sp. NPDC008313]|uniref:hypothetical protein n=1 Tax=Streptomyces sp. NPDC008313 TaxID=3364826 RepID=UPI0036E1D3F7